MMLSFGIVQSDLCPLLSCTRPPCRPWVSCLILHIHHSHHTCFHPSEWNIFQTVPLGLLANAMVAWVVVGAMRIARFAFASTTSRTVRPFAAHSFVTTEIVWGPRGCRASQHCLPKDFADAAKSDSPSESRAASHCGHSLSRLGK